MTTLVEQLAALTPAEREKLLAELPSEAPPKKRTPLDVSQAVDIGPVILDLVDDSRVKDKTFVGTTIWLKGQRNVRGPKGGVYCRARVVLGRKGQSVKGWLQIADRNWTLAEGGGAADCWVTIDGQPKATLVGIMQNARVPAGR